MNDAGNRPDPGGRPAAWPGFGLNLIGDIKTGTGLGEAGRSLARAVLDLGIPAELLPLAHAKPWVVRAALAHPIPASRAHPANLLLYNINAFSRLEPAERQRLLGGRYTIAHWYWELSRPGETFRPLLDEVDEIWAPTRFCAECLSGGTARVEVIPPAVDLPPPGRRDRPAYGLPEKRFVFLFAFSAYSSFVRKNPLGVVRAFEKAFGARGNGGPLLVIKAQHAAHSPAERDELREAVARVGGMLFERTLSRRATLGLLHAADAFVSLHRSEGFGLGPAESMALGKPVIATFYSGNTDFMTPENSYPVGFELRPTRDADGASERVARDLYAGEGQVWAEPDLDEAAALMRRVVERPREARAKGARAARDIAALYGLEACKRRIAARLRQIDPALLSARIGENPAPQPEPSRRHMLEIALRSWEHARDADPADPAALRAAEGSLFRSLLGNIDELRADVRELKDGRAGLLRELAEAHMEAIEEENRARLRAAP
jgi:glycosyltransferase involved in cell wall biosynthesis